MVEAFGVEEFLPLGVVGKLRRLRAIGSGGMSAEEIVKKEADHRFIYRRSNPAVPTDGRLVIVAADHPARAIGSPGESVAPEVGENYQKDAAMFYAPGYLARVVRAASYADGVMAPSYLIEDMFLLSHLSRHEGEPTFMDKMFLIGCMQRLGLQGAAHELDDMMSSFTTERLEELRMDGGKVMWRYTEIPGDATGELKEKYIQGNRDAQLTAKYIADVVTANHGEGIRTFVEPLYMTWDGNKWASSKNPRDQAKVNVVASALGSSSTGTWLKIPYCGDDMAFVVNSSTCPKLVLGGASKGDVKPLLEDAHKSLEYGAEGLLQGRGVLYCGPNDPGAVALAMYQMAHGGASLDDALRIVDDYRGTGMDMITSRLK